MALLCENKLAASRV